MLCCASTGSNYSNAWPDSQENWITPDEILYMWPEAYMPPWVIMKQLLSKKGKGAAAHHKAHQDPRALWRGVAGMADLRQVGACAARGGPGGGRGREGARLAGAPCNTAHKIIIPMLRLALWRHRAYRVPALPPLLPALSQALVARVRGNPLFDVENIDWADVRNGQPPAASRFIPLWEICK